MKIKLFLFLCLFATLNISCSDDKDDTINLTAGELSITKGKLGDEITITGAGFSKLKEENIVTINDLVIPVQEATSSKLVITIPKEAETGNLSVNVSETSIDFGIFTVLKEKLFAFKSDYGNGHNFIVTINHETGIEELFMELPELDQNVDIMYSSLCYLSETKEFLIMTRAECPVKDYSVLKIDIATKKITKKDFTQTDEIEDIRLFTDGESKVYLTKYFNAEYHETTQIKAKKTSIYDFNIETGAQVLLTEVIDNFIFDSKVNKATNQLLMVIYNNEYWDRSTKLLSFDFDTKKQIEIPLTDPKSLYGFIISSDNDIYIANETVFEEQIDLLKINTTTGAEDLVVKLPNPKEWYGYPLYSETTNELIYFLTNDNDETTTLFKVDLTNKTTSEINLQANNKAYYEPAFSIFI